MPLLIVQPLVENAVRHGLAPQVRGGTLVVREARDQGRTRIDVETPRRSAARMAAAGRDRVFPATWRVAPGGGVGDTAALNVAPGEGGASARPSRSLRADMTTAAGPWRTVVVDDEPLARQTLRLLLAGEEDFAIVAECGHGADAIDTIRRERPDLVFLDVQMPEVDGFEVLRQLEPGTVPAVVFVTAFDRYALQAFEQHALDYLLKPFSDERFANVLARTRVRLRERTFASMAQRTGDLVAASAPERRQLAVRDGSRRW